MRLSNSHLSLVAFGVRADSEARDRVVCGVDFGS